MEKTPKVSIIIPVYNGADFLDQSINSALKQTYKNIEIIVVNDGSNDNGKTEKIAKSFGDKIKYFKKENGGVASALNFALDKMTGEYFSWLSHDDLYKPNKIENEIDAILKLNNEKCIILSNYELINESNEHITNVVMNHEMLIKNNEMCLFRGCINGITLLIPKAAFDETGKFNEQLWCTQDYDMWYRMMMRDYKFIHVPEILASSRQHSMQTTNTSPKMLKEGNDLWINLTENFPLKFKKKINKTEYAFYIGMRDFLKNTPYNEALNFCNNKIENFKHNFNENIENYKVSVVIPFYNTPKKELNRSINSVFKQTHKNIELILINDGSTNTYHDLEDRIKKYDNIIYINYKKNKGVSHARNIGISKSTGSYIALLDSDDEFMPDKIHKQLLEMLLSDSVISHTSYCKISENSKFNVNSGILNGDVLNKVIYNCTIATPTVMLKSEYIKKNNIMYDENINISEDAIFYLSILKNNNLLGIGEMLTNVYVNENSTIYNLEKQFVGLKNILNYILQDNVLKDKNESISILCGVITEYYNTILNPKQKKTNVIIKLLHYIKKYGLIKTISKVKNIIFPKGKKEI